MDIERETRKRYKERIADAKTIKDEKEKQKKLFELKKHIELYDIAVQLCYPQEVKDKIFEAKDLHSIDRILHDARFAC